MALTSEEIETLMDVLTREDRNEKRRQKRQDVKLRGVAPAYGMEEVEVSQISNKGARFITDLNLEPQQQLRVLIDHPTHPMTLVLKVIRKDPDSLGLRTYGAEILELIR